MKRGLPWLVAGVAALALGCQKNRQPDDAMDERNEPAMEEPQSPEDEPFAGGETDEMAQIPIGEIVASPAEWAGEEIEGTARVAQVATDRVFWIEDQGTTLLAILLEEHREDQVRVQQGQRIRIDGATVRTPSDLSQIEGDPLDADSAQLAFSQPVFLVLEAGDISVLSGPGS